MPKRRRESDLEASSLPFVYSPLAQSIDSSFRICTVLPGDEGTAVSCLLSHDDWRAPRAPYEAVSYVWGDQETNKTIILDGHSLNVRPNLEALLRNLRRSGRAKSQRRRLWIDAICINQADLIERNQQVQRMYHIYHAAEKVLVWLGEAYLGSDAAISFMNDTLKPSLESAGYSCTNEQANVVSKFWYNWDEGKDAETLEAVDHLVVPKHRKHWSAVVRLCQRPWWIRAWTVQELISAREATVVCGKTSVSWPLLDMTIQLMLRNTPLEHLFSKRDQGTFQNTIEDAHAFAYERSHRILSGPGPEDFVQLMQVTRCRQSQDPRDKVFSILSLIDTDSTKYSYQPDYSQPVEVTYLNVARAHIRSTNSLHILSSCCILEKASTPGLPSWVPNWAISFDMSYLGGYSAKDIEFRYCASGTLPAAIELSESLPSLTVSGVCIDTIKNNQIQGTQEFDYLLTSAKDEPWCSWDIHQIVENLEASGTSVVRSENESVLQATLTTLVVDRNPEYGKRKQKPQLQRLRKHIWPKDLEVYLSHVQMYTQGRTLIVSENGYIGLAPSATRPGDKICILLGCHAPVIVRQSPDEDEKYYILVGDAYVHGLMDGEAISTLDEDPQKIQKFVIR